MKFYWSMPAGLKIHYENEPGEYRAGILKDNLHSAWRHLKRAHIIGQAWTEEHNYVH